MNQVKYYQILDPTTLSISIGIYIPICKYPVEPVLAGIQTSGTG